MRCIRYFFFSLIACGVSASASAQQPVVRAELDSMNIVVGGQVGLNVSVAVPKGHDCHILALPDTLSPEVEVVEALKPDTIDRGDLVEYMRRYIVTSFDTGLHYVGPIPMVVEADSSLISTPDFSLSVINPFQQMEVAEDGTNKITDINGAEDAPFQWGELLLYWPWALGAVILVALIFLVRFLIKKYGRKDGETAKIVVPEEPCELTAMRDLERIREEKLWMHNQVKEFYSELTETLRRYVVARYGIQAMESTSSEIMEQLAKPLATNQKEAEMLSEILSQADYVKFAKMEPQPDENDRAVANAIDFVNLTTEEARRQEAADKAAAASVNPIDNPTAQSAKPLELDK